MPFPKRMFIYEIEQTKGQSIWSAVEHRCELGLAMDGEMVATYELVKTTKIRFAKPRASTRKGKD